MIRQSIKVPEILRMISWLDDGIIDWASGGMFYGLNGEISQKGFHYFDGQFDRSIMSQDGQYAFVYKNLGTKGVLLKNGEILREINRSFYQAEKYEYPAAFYTSPGGLTYLIHCPYEYCRLDFEEVESGKIVTDVPKRSPTDIFHSRLEISPDNKFLMVRGWVWDPMDVIQVYDINACLQDPTMLDSHVVYPANAPSECCIGAFINNDQILIGTERADNGFERNQLAVWDFKKQEITNPVKVLGMFGNIVAVQGNMAWDFNGYPKIIDLQTGEIVDKLEEVATSTQTSSIIHHLHRAPAILFNRKLNKVAVMGSSDPYDHSFYDQIEILSINF